MAIMSIAVKLGGKRPDVLLSLAPTTTIAVLRQTLYRGHHVTLPLARMAFRNQQRGPLLGDNDTLEKGCADGVVYIKDLGPQIGWKTVFVVEYVGPLVVYLLFYMRPSFIYGAQKLSTYNPVVHVAAACWSFHYIKRVLETIFVHRFSHQTMPLRNLFKNCSYYWGFAAFVAYFVNHPLYTPPMYGRNQFLAGLGLFVICELGNLSIHLALRNLRPAGSKERHIPYGTKNPFTWLFAYVSCPNYTYETGAWLGYSIMTQSVPGLIFMVAGFVQMAIWARGKQRNYKKEFKDYPKGRKPIVPFLL